MMFVYNRCPECGDVNNTLPDVCMICGCNLEDYRMELRKQQAEQESKAAEEACIAEEKRIEELKTRLAAIRQKMKPARGMISVGDSGVAGKFSILGCKSDGTAISTAYDVDMWTDIVSVSAQGDFAMGLKADGTVICSRYYKDLDETASWLYMVAIQAGRHGECIGLDDDGAVLSVGDFDIEEWDYVVSVALSDHAFVFLYDDGTINLYYGALFGKLDHHLDWKDVVAVAVGEHTMVGLTAVGTVKFIRPDQEAYFSKSPVDECILKEYCYTDWEDIVDVAVCRNNIVGLKADGTVVVDHFQEFRDLRDSWDDVRNWEDIVAISCHKEEDGVGTIIVGLKRDGTVVVSPAGSYDVSDWKLFDDFDNLEEEKKIAREKLAKEEEELWASCELVEKADGLEPLDLEREDNLDELEPLGLEDEEDDDTDWDNVIFLVKKTDIED